MSQEGSEPPAPGVKPDPQGTWSPEDTSPRHPATAGQEPTPSWEKQRDPRGPLGASTSQGNEGGVLFRSLSLPPGNWSHRLGGAAPPEEPALQPLTVTVHTHSPSPQRWQVRFSAALRGRGRATGAQQETAISVGHPGCPRQEWGPPQPLPLPESLQAPGTP